MGYQGNPLQTVARCWNIPATENCPINLCIIEDERGMVTLDDSPQGWHHTNNPELIRLTQFKIYLHKTEQCGL